MKSFPSHHSIVNLSRRSLYLSNWIYVVKDRRYHVNLDSFWLMKYFLKISFYHRSWQAMSSWNYTSDNWSLTSQDKFHTAMILFVALYDISVLGTSFFAPWSNPWNNWHPNACFFSVNLFFVLQGKFAKYMPQLSGIISVELLVPDIFLLRLKSPTLT